MKPFEMLFQLLVWGHFPTHCIKVFALSGWPVFTAKYSCWLRGRSWGTVWEAAYKADLQKASCYHMAGRSRHKAVLEFWPPDLIHHSQIGQVVPEDWGTILFFFFVLWCSCILNTSSCDHNSMLANTNVTYTHAPPLPHCPQFLNGQKVLSITLFLVFSTAVSHCRNNHLPAAAPSAVSVQPFDSKRASSPGE